MFLGILAVDIGLTFQSGTVASSAVTHRIDFHPEGKGLLGGMEQASRRLDQLGYEAFGRHTPLAEILLYGILSPLFIAGPAGWEAGR